MLDCHTVETPLVLSESESMYILAIPTKRSLCSMLQLMAKIYNREAELRTKHLLSAKLFVTNFMTPVMITWTISA